MKPASKPVQRPPDARLLVVGADGTLGQEARHRLPDVLQPGDLLVANDAATIPASLHGVHEPTGAAIEVRLAGRRTLDRGAVSCFTAIVFGSGNYRTRTEERPLPPRLRSGERLRLGPLTATVMGRRLGHRRLVDLCFAQSPDHVWAALAHYGKPIQYAHISEPLALWDIRTPIASRPVAFEPPSAGFVADWNMLHRLEVRGIGFATLTLAAGISSTGDPALDAKLPLDEPYEIPDTTVRSIQAVRNGGGRVVALGTTVTRALEDAARQPRGLASGPGLATLRLGRETPLRIVDAIVTGTHEPGESHYALLRAFAEESVLQRMTMALEAGEYRSHEFGDSILLERSCSTVEAARVA